LVVVEERVGKLLICTSMRKENIEYIQFLVFFFCIGHVCLSCAACAFNDFALLIKKNNNKYIFGTLK